ncbi:hypothetical protein LVD15_06935 [Fulvivirga maritima]|uniref:hypothetical protein n=1 Tax=Fulvivirga maritima TaxID=2904247 RepID=UPI001F4082DE|nr:hypothetical protein [Fulvivirga maritima]UII28152.1 hypothetical protein LVD15_06935 [Fulvivirga maritima]
MKPEKEISYYYNIDSLMTAQKNLLIARGAVIHKSAIVAGDTATSTIEPDSAVWDKEFKIFENININKPTLRGVYTQKDYQDSKSNLKIRSYSTNNEDVEIKYLKIYYLDDISNIKKVEAKYEEDNPVYHSARLLRFTFDDIKKEPVLTHYQIIGDQKTILRDPVKIKINSKVAIR